MDTSDRSPCYGGCKALLRVRGTRHTPRLWATILGIVLARQNISALAYCSIEECLGKNQQVYYDVLGQVGAGHWHPDRDARPWVRLCLTAHYRQAPHLVKWSRICQRLWDNLEIEIRERGLPDRILLALNDSPLATRSGMPLTEKRQTSRS